jgi:hypothetical protein
MLHSFVNLIFYVTIQFFPTVCHRDPLWEERRSLEIASRALAMTILSGMGTGTFLCT